jgi:copper resistance protein B
MIRGALLLLLLTSSADRAFAQGTPAAPDPHAGHVMPTAKPSQNGSAEPLTPIPPVTDEDRAAAFPQELHGHAVHDRAVNYYVLFDQFEWQAAGDTSGAIWDAKAWVGGDVNRIWIHSEGAAEETRLEEAEVHVTYGRSFARWWDVVAGIRRDVRPGPGQTWAAVGIQGLAPQWFELQATLYIGESAATLARFEAEYELLVTNRLVLQPLLEINLYGKSIPERGIGAGISSTEGGLRLRYEIRRELAPYVGAVWHREFGGTADYSRSAGHDIGGWRLAAGVRTWF